MEVNEKRCAKCLEVKHISKFSRNAKMADKLRSDCKLCISSYVRSERARKKEALINHPIDEEEVEAPTKKQELPIIYDRIVVLETVEKTANSWAGIIASEGEDLFAEMSLLKNGTMWVSSLDRTGTKKATKKRGIRRVAPKEAYALYKQ